MCGLATGSIVLIVGSSAFHGAAGRLSPFYASPLLVLGGSVAYSLLFMAVQILTYEDVSHGHSHTALQYALNETFGFSALACFLIGYFWLIIAVTR